MKIKMLKTVRDPMGPMGTILHRSCEYQAEKAGSFVFGVCQNGYKILLKNGEWEEVNS